MAAGQSRPASRSDRIEMPMRQSPCQELRRLAVRAGLPHHLHLAHPHGSRRCQSRPCAPRHVRRAERSHSPETSPSLTPATDGELPGSLPCSPEFRTKRQNGDARSASGGAGGRFGLLVVAATIRPVTCPRMRLQATKAAADPSDCGACADNADRSGEGGCF